MNIAGGTHHAFRDRAEAFCMLNDQAIGTNYLFYNHLASKILIIDLDVQLGNGTASIFNSDNRVSQYRFMERKITHKEKALDIEFDDDTDDKEYLNKINENIPKVIDEPDFIFYLSGETFKKMID